MGREAVRKPAGFWYYPPFKYSSWGYDHGSDEWNRCTHVIGTPVTGHLVIPKRRKAMLDVDSESNMAYVWIRQETDDLLLLKTVELGHGINIDIHPETGNLIGVEIDMNYREEV